MRCLAAISLYLALSLGLAAPAMAQGGASVETEQGPAALIADRVRVEGAARLVAEGSVEVIYGSARMRASRISFDRATGKLVIEGPITLVEGDSVLILADAAELDADLRNGILSSARLVLDQKLQLAAAQVRRVEGRYTELSKTVASSCQVCADNPVPLWSIRARRVVHDQEARQLYFDDATFRVLDLPVLWLPRLRLPDPTLKRATGFLIPDLRSTSLLGTGLKVPYFIALGDSRDLTFTPYVSAQTRTLEMRYRQAFRRGRIEFEGALSRDTLLPDLTRGYLFGQGRFDLPRDFRLSFAVELTTETDYLLDYGYSDADRLTSFLRADRIRRNERIVGRLINFRTLRDSEIPIEDTLPYFLGSATWEKRFPGLAGGEGSFALTLQGHQRTSDVDIDGRDVVRLGFQAGWRRSEIFGPGIEAEFEGRLTADAYSVSQDSTYPGRFSLVTPALGLTLRWPLARTTAGGATSVLEPLAQVAWSKSYGTLPPNEDSALVEFDEGNLLSLNRYPGHDGQETGLRAAVGLKWSHFAPQGWSMGATVGRVFRSQADSGFTASSGLDGSSSDWLLGFRLGIGSRLGLSSRTLLDDSLSVTKSETRLTYSDTKLNLGASYIWLIADPDIGLDSQTNEVTLDGSYKLGRNWTGQFGIRYDAEVDRAASASLGLAYSNECVTLDLSLSRRFTSSTSVEPTTDVGLKVALNGFGNDGRIDRGSCAR
ncbi:LPS-assembly protein LptD [Frigidibacter sp. ROC022]|uniref:LPS-assembly protein LptD n=1 Tax=Frigidibacter sp. ROC022 TaxID=2971796 RepID=UPI00215B050F|nr:LPS assembly protein LptD [Frigidibacter sp. ROC022]MCR8726355.1 LPS assembly protein LptD [Frigidibacter sp. ROC022]